MDYFYVIAPVSADPDFSAKRAIVTDVASSFGVATLFPLDRHPIVALERTSDDIRKAKFILADLSYERPSCYFELGLAEATGVEVSIIASTGTKIHQVGYASQVNFYRNLDDYRSLIASILHGRMSRVAESLVRRARR